MPTIIAAFEGACAVRISRVATLRNALAFDGAHVVCADAKSWVEQITFASSTTAAPELTRGTSLLRTTVLVYTFTVNCALGFSTNAPVR